MGIRRLFPILAGVLLATSCSLEVPTDTGSIVVYLAVDKGTLLQEETLTVTVTARNVGYGDVTLTGPSDCLIYIEVRNSSGLIVHSSDANCVGSTVTETVGAGLDRVQVFTWDGTVRAGSHAPSGLYSIRAIARVTGDPYRGPSLTIAVE